MQLRSSELRYGAVAQLFHWIIVAMIITQFILASQAEDLPMGLHKLATLARHKSVGMTIFGLAVLRLLWRWWNPTPRLPPDMPAWERWGAHFSHFALYALLLLQPLSGWLMSSAKNYSVSWFGLFTFPNLVQPDEGLFEFFKTVHQVLAGTLFFVALLHILAALKHHFWNKDDVLRRMLPMRLRSKTG